MDFLRLILPQVVFLLSSFFIIWVISYFVKREVSQDVWKVISKWRGAVVILVLSFFLIWVAKVASVNEIPRSEPNHSVKKEMGNDFEERMKNDTVTKK